MQRSSPNFRSKESFVYEIHDIRRNVLPKFIDGFHGDVIRLLSQKSEVLRILIYTRLKINRK